MMPTKEKKKDESKRRLKGLQLFRRSKSKPAPALTPAPPSKMPPRSASAATSDQAPLPEIFKEAVLRHSADDLSSLMTDSDLPPSAGRELALSPVSMSLHSLTSDSAPLQTRIAPWDTPTPNTDGGEPHSSVVAGSPAVNGDGRCTTETRSQREQHEQVVRVRKVTTDHVDHVTLPVGQENVDPKQLRSIIMEKMRGMGNISEQVSPHIVYA